jgi:FkbM family methyltransferase
MLKSIVRKALHRRGLDLVRTPSMLSFLEFHRVDLVLDVGGNIGQYGRDLRDRGYTGRIWSFEPVQAVFDKLQAGARGDDRWQVTRSAVGATPGQATINVSEATVFSSIKSANKTARDFDSRVASVEKQVVPVATLNDLTKDETARHIFLKIDTQGFEKEVLDGASILLPKLVGIQLEVPVQNLYDDVWSFPECIDHMDRLGFTPAQFAMVNTMREDPASAIEFDCIFRRKS